MGDLAAAPAWPTLNASLNATSAVLLATGYAFIRRGRVSVHRGCMLAAFAVSTAFLGSYVAYHVQVGTTSFQGQGLIRPVYFGILLTHTVLAAAVVPLVLVTLDLPDLAVRLGHRRRRVPHPLPLELTAPALTARRATTTHTTSTPHTAVPTARCSA